MRLHQQLAPNAPLETISIVCLSAPPQPTLLLAAARCLLECLTACRRVLAGLQRWTTQTG